MGALALLEIRFGLNFFIATYKMVLKTQPSVVSWMMYV